MGQGPARTGPDRARVSRVIPRFAGAALRALLVVLLVATPALALPGLSAETTQAVVFVALFAAALVLVEYTSAYPGLVEFRFAPPFNRLRFAGLLATVVLLSLLMRGPGAAAPEWLDGLAATLGARLDFAYSPVRLVTLMLPEGAPPGEVAVLRGAAAVAAAAGAATVASFALLVGIGRWPARRRDFNLWVNLPTFDPMAGGDICQRLERDAAVNLALGFVLPFVIPAVAKAGAVTLGSVSLGAPQSLVWVVAAWAFLPGSLLMRGLAMGRIARMIRAQRQATAAPGRDTLAPA